MNMTTLSRRGVLAALGTSAFFPVAAWPASAPAAIAEYERATGGRAGLFARDLKTGREIAWRANERFAMCSTFKLSLAASVLARVDAGREQLDRAVSFGAPDILSYAPAAKAHLDRGTMTVGEMCEAAVVLSDNTCANILLRETGGPAALTRFWRGLGDTTSRLDHNEPELNRNKFGQPEDTTTPTAMAHTVAKLATSDVLSAASRDRLVGWMVACQTGLHKLRAGLPTAWRVGDKTGNNGSDASGDIAVAWPTDGGPIVMAAYVQGGTPTAQQQDALFAAIGRFVAG